MSYILDALRRADAERERDRGAVPGLHAQPVAPLSADVGAPRRAASRRVGAAAAMGLVALLIGGGLWVWRTEPAPVRAAATQVTVGMPAAVVPPTAPLPAAATLPAAPPTAATPPAVLVPPAPLRSAPPRTAPAAAASASTSAATRDVAAPAPSRRSATVADARPFAPAGASASASAPDRVPTQAELPEALRRELPTLSFGGAMFSPTPANRMLIVNGQVFREGDKIAPELWLEQIKLKDAVLRYKGQRYSVTF